MIATTVNIVVGQRLVRKICQNCKESYKLTKAEEQSINDLGNFASGINKTVYRGRGCTKCLDSGYRGRIGIYEVMVVDDAIREAMLSKSSAAHIKKIAMERGMTTMIDDGFSKVFSGITTPEEVLRVTQEVDI